MIPRPATAEPGGPPPWRARTGISLATVLDGLRRAGRLLAEIPTPTPACDAQAGVGASSGPPAAVLVALFEEQGEARVLLTRRAEHLRTHSGQISFPGGRMEKGEDPVAGALREAAEEVGLDPGSAHPVAVLSQGFAVSSGDAITPVVAFLDARPRLVPNPGEVARAFDASLAELASSYWSERWTVRGARGVPMDFFGVAGETVWGATARMLTELLTDVLADD